MSRDERYMRRCLKLASQGKGRVEPNPMVGCVIVHKGKVIGEGYHEYFGGPHAEVNAIKSVKKKDASLLSESTLYVNLEPCSHFGKTPPCADLLMKHKIGRVVVGALDPNPKVSGKGISKLISSGVDVKVGVLQDECRELNKRFYTFHQMKRPYIILKWAQTSDGYIGALGQRILISGPRMNKLVHKWRSEEQAIMVGTNTALIDNPRLTVRNMEGKNPLRVVVDRTLKVPANFNLLDQSARTIVFTSKKKASKNNLEYVIVNFNKGILKQIMQKLHNRGIQSIIVEGGAKLLYSFIRANLWDEARIIMSTKKFSELSREKGIRAPNLS